MFQTSIQFLKVSDPVNQYDISYFFADLFEIRKITLKADELITDWNFSGIHILKIG